MAEQPPLPHEHNFVQYEGPLLTPAEKETLGLHKNILYFKNGRCTFPGCREFQFAVIQKPLKVRLGPRIVR